MIPFLKIVGFCDIKATCFDLQVLCYRLNNDIVTKDKQSFKFWIQLIFNVALPIVPNNPNYLSRELVQWVMQYVKALIALYQHIITTNYTWINSLTGDVVNLLEYYLKMDAPLSDH